MTDSPADRRQQERRAARKLRAQLEPSAELMLRLQKGLDQAARKETARDARPRPQQRWSPRVWRNLFLLLPAAVSVALALFVNLDTPAFEAMRTAEHHLALPDAGHGTVHVRLALHEHDDDSARVALVVSKGMRITSLSNHLTDELSRSCKGESCRYEFDHPTTSDTPHVAVHVSEPGSYRMEIEHASSNNRVRELVLIHARR
jgi:hypothetical protein